MSIYSSSNLFSTAQAYASLGFQLFPCHSIENGVCTCGRADCKDKDIAKHPLTDHGVKDATSDPTKLKEYFTGAYSIANIAVATGEPSGVVVLDADNLDDLSSLEGRHGKLPTTWTAITGSGGRHFYFRFNERCKALKNAVKFAGALDVRATGGYTLLPPSKHRTGNIYRWEVSPDACELAPLPDWLFDLMPKHGETVARCAGDHVGVHSSPLTITRASTPAERAELYLKTVSPAISGQRGHAKAFTVACRLRELFGECSDDELYSAFETWNKSNEPPFTDKELRHKFDDAKKRISSSSIIETEAVEYPTLHSDALHGLAGEIISAIEPETEADIAGVLLSFLVAFGHAVGRTPYFFVGASTHHANIFVCLVGDTSSAKGMAWDVARYVVPKEHLSVSYGLSSGEGLVERVSDPPNDDDDIFYIPPPKSLLCLETEFARPITAMRREGNTLSPLLRSAWDCTTMEIMTRGKSKLRASNAYVSILAHITPEELRHILSNKVEIANGFANRFLWGVVRSTKSLPNGGNVSVLAASAARTQHAIEAARTIGEMRRTPDADALWASVYDYLKQSKPGAYGKATERGRPYVVRLSMIYALLDGNPNIDVRHLRAALAVWDYCEASARLVFGDAETNKLEYRLYNSVVSKPGIMRSELRSSVSHSISTEVFDAAISALIRRGKIVSVPTMGNRQAECFYVGVDDGKRDLAGYRDIAPKPDAKSPISQYPTPSGNGTPVARAAGDVPETAATPSVLAASLSELFDWRNQNSVAFHRRDDGRIWVAAEYEPRLTPAIITAINANQETLSAFVQETLAPAATSTTSTVNKTVDDYAEFVAKINAIGNEPPEAKMTPQEIAEFFGETSA